MAVLHSDDDVRDLEKGDEDEDAEMVVTRPIIALLINLAVVLTSVGGIIKFVQTAYWLLDTEVSLEVFAWIALLFGMNAAPISALVMVRKDLISIYASDRPDDPRSKLLPASKNV